MSGLNGSLSMETMGFNNFRVFRAFRGRCFFLCSRNTGIPLLEAVQAFMCDAGQTRYVYLPMINYTTC